MSFLVASLVTGASSAYAAENTTLKDEAKTVETINSQYKDSAGNLVNEKTYLNEDGEVTGGEVEIGKSPTSDGGFGIMAAPHFSANSKTSRQVEAGWIQLRVFGTGSSKAYTSSSKTSYKAIDSIGVNTILYYNNTVEDTASSTKSNSSTAAATAKQEAINCCFGYKTQSNHSFKEAGYSSWYPTTTHYLN
ncbi:hypothetical protein [Metabacillus niabensis]|uniref:hypothetical protein n=1 Tax=Metabacillus niabensis TaxID=324854 RepID=UPI001CFA74C6|nr:hypothetical protein [Metabacillus niabensis]